MTSRRAQQVEQVFQQHHCNRRSPHARPCHLACVVNTEYDALQSFTPCQALVADLLALQPTPSQQTAQKLADAWLAAKTAYDALEDIRPAGGFANMAWATGEAERPTWCRHCVWVEDGDIGRQGWCYDRCALPHTMTQLSELHSRYVKIADEFDICPVTGCHAPRPGAG